MQGYDNVVSGVLIILWKWWRHHIDLSISKLALPDLYEIYLASFDLMHYKAFIQCNYSVFILFLRNVIQQFTE